MAQIPTLPQARQMVSKALKERLPEAHRQLSESSDLASFSDLLARAILEKIEAQDDPSPALQVRGSLIERAQGIRDIRDAAIERVLAELLSTESLEAEISSFRPEA